MQVMEGSTTYLELKYQFWCNVKLTVKKKLANIKKSRIGSKSINLDKTSKPVSQIWK